MVKRSVAYACMLNSCQKSCVHAVARSLMNQVDRLRKSNYPDALIASLAEKLLKGFRTSDKIDESKEKSKERPIVLPYIHNVSHGLKKIAIRFGIPMVFKAPNKLISLCHKVNNNQQRSSKFCSVSHSDKFNECEKEVVYFVPLSCGRKYIGQTGRCINTQLREHNMATHCNWCQCHPKFDNTTIVSRCNNSKEREIIEAFAMHRAGGDFCVSAPSLSLTEAEVSFVQDKEADRPRDTWALD